MDNNQNSQHRESNLPFHFLNPNKECLFSKKTQTNKQIHIPQVMCWTDILTPTLIPTGIQGQEGVRKVWCSESGQRSKGQKCLCTHYFVINNILISLLQCFKMRNKGNTDLCLGLPLFQRNPLFIHVKGQMASNCCPNPLASFSIMAQTHSNRPPLHGRSAPCPHTHSLFRISLPRHSLPVAACAFTAGPSPQSSPLMYLRLRWKLLR